MNIAKKLYKKSEEKRYRENRKAEREFKKQKNKPDSLVEKWIEEEGK